MRGGLKTIQRLRPFIICEVLENVDHAYVEQAMRALQYRFYHITSAQLERHDHLQGMT